jgi:hypothetical protein
LSSTAESAKPLEIVVGGKTYQLEPERPLVIIYS